MKIAIIGAGAMGSLFGAALSFDNNVCLYSHNKQYVEAVSRNGLIVTQGEARQELHIPVTDDARAVPPSDIAMIFVKSTGLRRAIEDAKLNCITPDTLVLLLQNGIGNVEIAKELLPEGQIAYGLTAMTSDMVEPGHIERTTKRSVWTYFWPVTGEISPAARALEAAMNAAGFSTKITKDVETKIWKKLMVNCSQNTLCGILHVTVGRLMETPESFGLVKQIVYEVADVAKAKGIRISREEGFQYVLDVSHSVMDHIPSMALDIRNHRRTEIASLNEAVVSEGERLHVETPMLRFVGKMVRTLEANYDSLAF